MHDIPVRFLKPEVAEDICDIAGDVDRLVDNSVVEGGSYMRVRVTVDISEPLCRGRFISFEEDSEHWVRFKYEHLPNIRCRCGCLDHSNKDCEIWIESNGTLKVVNQKFGPWIRASPLPPPKRSVIVVQGYYEKTSHGGPNRRFKVPTPVAEATATSPPPTGPIPDTVIDDIGEKISEVLISESTIPKESCSTEEGNNGCYGDILSAKITEIDTELGKFDDHWGVFTWGSDFACIKIDSKPFLYKSTKSPDHNP